MSPEAHQVWLGESGRGDGSRDPLLCRSPAGRLVTQPVSLRTRVGLQPQKSECGSLGTPYITEAPAPPGTIGPFKEEL